MKDKDGWKSCDNCKDQRCYRLMQHDGLPTNTPCDDWKPIRCRCGGALSTIREHNGKKYRHCYSCHFEFKVTNCNERKQPMGRMIPVCVYCDTTGLYSEDEMNKDNLVDLLFPREIVESYYMENKRDFDEETSGELGIPISDCDFNFWIRDVYTADDTQNLYEFAKRCGFTAKKR